MPHEFEVREEIVLEATPEQVWQAIATGPGIDSWFMGRNEVEPREGGTTRQTLMGHTSEATITAYDPARRFAYRTAEDAEGAFMAFEYLLEGRDGGSTVLRFVHSGMLGGDWEAEYDALRKGDGMYLRKLAAYVEHFPGRTSTFNVFAVGPQVPGQERVWQAFTHAVGATGAVAEGDRVRLQVNGITPVDGVVQFAYRPDFLGVRTGDGLYVFIHGHQDTVLVEYHGFSPETDDKIEPAWQSWMAQAFA
ncbi:SRPBCC domain-containing protein [Sphaerisporangium sp. TRM90804]|uniref:SRPBCC family protein n=1 Tax=Sphaerisporangium sp. TRM90804 TaxID=3031113 RepID=UPI00244A0667|nr:SRPBCC domain-containing protein [Sphaerisporangium sp. TRM90804]MDH2426149.1 SRPBCC domain-containing protein [Sphaerisporangium sp. TRM90804]